MKIPRTLKRFLKGFTLIELLVVIGIIALLASIAVPAFTGVQIRAAQTKAMSNAKQIGLACKQYAIDNNGSYPTGSFALASSTSAATGTATSANDAFNNLFPSYLTTISIFYQPKSAFTPGAQPSDPPLSQMQPGGGGALTTGQNEWAYVLGLYDTSSATFPLIADGFATLANHTYTTSETAKGGVWKGQAAVVVFCDDSAKVIHLLGTTTINVPGGPGGTDMFLGTNNWLDPVINTVVNPL
jgi:prepilin-type N-terminal cleavage/methylation domain-containing protein